jgi:hypothetical protein
MNFNFTIEEKFRKEVREYLAKELPPEWKELNYT